MSSAQHVDTLFKYLNRTLTEEKISPTSTSGSTNRSAPPTAQFIWFKKKQSIPPLRSTSTGPFCHRDVSITGHKTSRGSEETWTLWMRCFDVTRVKWCAVEQKGRSEASRCGSSYPGGLIGGTGLATWGPRRLVGPLFHTCHRERDEMDDSVTESRLLPLFRYKGRIISVLYRDRCNNAHTKLFPTFALCLSF